MFLRRCLRRKRGKVHTYWALVESYRTKKGSRQRVVTYLGELKPSERSGWAELGRRLDHRERPQPTLFDPPALEDSPDHEPVLVRLKGVRLERKRDFGEVWLALGLWRLVGLDVVLERLLPQRREQVPWPLVAAILVIARFCRPSSELHIEHTWYRGTALEELLGVPFSKVHTDRLYEGLDVILPHKAALEKHLKERLGNLFDLQYELLLYDVTSTYFEGQCHGNPQAKRGHSRDSRPDCLQVCIGLVVTEEGIPLGYEVFAGNTHDSKTIPDIVAAMEAKYGKAQRIWVLDRGMVSDDNLKFLRDRGAKYIVGTAKATLRKFEKAFTEGAWHTVQEGVEVKLANGPQGEETFVLARSADRREKEKAMHQRFLERLEAALNKLRMAAESGRLRDPAVANLRLGRLLQRYQRAAGAFDVKIVPLPAPEAEPLPTTAQAKPSPTTAEANTITSSGGSLCSSQTIINNCGSHTIPSSGGRKPHHYQQLLQAKPSPTTAEATPLPAAAEATPLPASAQAKPSSTTAEATPLPAAAEASAQAKPSSTTAEATPFPAAVEATPLPTTAQAKPSPTTAEATPLPAAAEATPLPASAQAKPSSTTAEATPLPAAEEATPLPASAQAKPSSTTAEATPLPVYSFS